MEQLGQLDTPREEGYDMQGRKGVRELILTKEVKFSSKCNGTLQVNKKKSWMKKKNTKLPYLIFLCIYLHLFKLVTGSLNFSFLFLTLGFLYQKYTMQFSFPANLLHFANFKWAYITQTCWPFNISSSNKNYTLIAHF